MNLRVKKGIKKTRVQNDSKQSEINLEDRCRGSKGQNMGRTERQTDNEGLGLEPAATKKIE